MDENNVWEDGWNGGAILAYRKVLADLHMVLDNENCGLARASLQKLACDIRQRIQELEYWTERNPIR